MKAREVRQGQTDLPPLISIEEASKVLGISRGAGYRAAASGGLPVLRWGGRLYVPSARLLTAVGLMEGAAEATQNSGPARSKKVG